MSLQQRILCYHKFKFYAVIRFVKTIYVKEKKEMSGQKEINRKKVCSLNKHTEIILVLERAFKANIFPQKFWLLTRFETSAF